MEGSGIKGLALKDSRTVPVESEQQQQRTLDGDTATFVENMKVLMDYHESLITISVEGFNTSSDPVELYKSLQRLFQTCGDVDFINIKIDPVTRQLNRSEVVSVTGYDSLLSPEDVRSALRKHFASCGEITDIFVLDNRARVHLYGLGSFQRAVRLNGTDLGGGFKLTVQEAEKPHEEAEAEADVSFI